MTRETAGERLDRWPDGVVPASDPGTRAVSGVVRRDARSDEGGTRWPLLRDADLDRRRAAPPDAVPPTDRPTDPGDRPGPSGGRPEAAPERGHVTRAQLSAAAARVFDPASMPPTNPPRRTPRWSITPRAAMLAGLALALVAGAAVLRSLSAVSGTPVDLAEPRGTASAAAFAEPTAATSTLLVHVVGQVVAPGLVELPPQARVADALDAAGGPLPDADLSALNLAAPVQDGAQVRVPAPGESAEIAAESAGSGLIDVNRASAAELEALPGVGPVLAGRIVADREANGPFATVDDLERVSGIGPSVLATLRDQATV